MAATYVSYFVADSIITAFDYYKLDNQLFKWYFKAFVVPNGGMVYFRN